METMEIIMAVLGVFVSFILPMTLFLRRLLTNQETALTILSGNGKDQIGVTGSIQKLRERADEIDEKIKALQATTKDYENLVEQVEDLHEWHDVKDADGVKIWYVRQSLENAIATLADGITEMNRLNGEHTIVLNHLVDLIKARSDGD